jgi:hypothetical protein
MEKYRKVFKSFHSIYKLERRKSNMPGGADFLGERLARPLPLYIYIFLFLCLEKCLIV